MDQSERATDTESPEIKIWYKSTPPRPMGRCLYLYIYKQLRTDKSPRRERDRHFLRSIPFSSAISHGVPAIYRLPPRCDSATSDPCRSLLLPTWRQSSGLSEGQFHPFVFRFSNSWWICVNYVRSRGLPCVWLLKKWRNDLRHCCLNFVLPVEKLGLVELLSEFLRFSNEKFLETVISSS